MIAIATLLLAVTVSLFVTRVATVILGERHVASGRPVFQVRSAFTGSGFTTRESERVVDHPLRRRVIMTLTLLGNTGIVAAASATILGFRSGGIGDQGWRVLEFAVGLFALVNLSRISWVDPRLTRLITRVDLSGEYAVSELAVTDRDWMSGRRLQELAFRVEGAVVLGVTQRNGNYLGAPMGNPPLSAGDVLIVYGRGELLRELEDRP